MVARNTDADLQHDHPPRGLISRFLLWWQRLLSHFVHESRSVADGVAIQVSRAVTDSEKSFWSLRSPALAWAGALAILIGAVGTVALSSPGIAKSVALYAGLMMLLWGGLRWALLRIAADVVLVRDQRAVRGAWAAGSLVWVLGLTPELRAVAWAASGVVTWLILERLGVTRRQTAICVGIAWAAQAFVVIGSWLARSAFIAILATRG